ncbi:MAG: hypothetical protein Q9M89_01425 [Persephonella sp.]|nr:hypothetical protein [Persephonella sp.]
MCKELGIDYVQGFLVAKPTTNIKELKSHYIHIEEISKKDRRKNVADRTFINNNMFYIKPVKISSSIMELINTIRRITRLILYL